MIWVHRSIAGNALRAFPARHIRLQRVQQCRFQSSRSSSTFSRTRVWVSGAALTLAASCTSYYVGKIQATKHQDTRDAGSSSTTKLSDLESPSYCDETQLQAAIDKVKQSIGPEVVFDTPVEIKAHTDNSFTTHSPKADQRPRFVIYPRCTGDVVAIMKIMHEFSVPVIPFGGGTSLEGHFFSTRPRSVVVDTSRMNQVLAVHHDDLDAVVQAGVNWQKLNEILAPDGLMLGTDCGPDGLISGMINTNASGINASRYGAMILNVVSVTVVLADGTVVKTKQRPRKSSAGYNLTGLMVGSEGTLGIVTEAVVKLHVKPKSETVIVGQFATVADATSAVAQIFRHGLQPNAIELLDRDMMHCINYSGYFTREWLEVPTIFFKVGGINEVVVNEQVKEIQKIVNQHNCQDFLYAHNDDEKEELFAARKNAFYAILNYGMNEIDPDVKLWVTDMAVPLSRLPPILKQLETMVKDSGLQSILLGHLGDSNIHFDIFYTKDTKQKVEDIVNQMMLIGLSNEGTSSGEHGIGNGKRRYLELELGPDAIDMMRRLKVALDPKRILNPDKIFKIDPHDQERF